MSKVLSLTPNRRLARFLQAQEGNRFISLNDWFDEVWLLQDQWSENEQPLQSLSDWQSALLWQSVINDLHPDPLLNQVQAVQQARAAWNLSIQWEVDPTQWKGEKAETDAFIRWLEAYQQRCTTHHWLDRALLPKRLLNYWKSHPKAIPEKVSFRGFDEFTPLIQSIIALWREQGAQVHIEAPSQDTQPYQYVCFEDRDSQLKAAAEFAKTALEEGASSLPIGIIIPAIQDDWANIYDTLTEVLGVDQPFNISAGQPLGLTPVVYAAIECLKIQSVSYLLKTPFIAGGMSEQSERALIDQYFSTFEQEALPWQFVRDHEKLPAQFKKICGQALDQLKQYQGWTLYPSEWIDKIFELLTLWGWPGDRTLNSDAYQAVTHFYRLITELSSLDQVLQRVSYSTILHHFVQRLNQTMFQAESQDKPIQVLGFLEAAGLHFSHLWVMDLGSDTWPDKPSPNPFIPMSVQSQLNLPHASFARELQFAQTMTRRMLTSSTHIVMSFAKQGNEGSIENMPTPLLSSECLKAGSVFDSGPKRQSNIPSGSLISAEGSYQEGLPFQSSQLSGGARVFKDQADCPFKAYAKHRLKAVKPERTKMGLSQRVKGNVVHEVLEKIWKELKNQSALISLGQESLQHLLDKQITLALNQVEPALSQIESDLEKKRLLPILIEWFEKELERPYFEILAVEQSKQFVFEGLSLKLRIDRLDQSEGKLCIIDYKTGKISKTAWETPRMDEPQLPLYACLHQPRPQAVAFAQIRKNESSFHASDELDFEGWQADLQHLAQAFKSGDSSVFPKRGPHTCSHCDLQSFCRINLDE